jgi:hypothetical protein
VSERTVKLSKRYGFSPFFLHGCGFVNAHKEEDVAMPLLALRTLAEMKMWRCGGATAGFALWHERVCVNSVKKLTDIFCTSKTYQVLQGTIMHHYVRKGTSKIQCDSTFSKD